MSIKIYTAYRLRDSKDFWALLRDVRRKGVKEVQKVLRSFYKDLLENVNCESAEFKKWLKAGSTPEDAKRHTVESLIRTGYRDQLGSSLNDIFDFDVSIVVREHKGKLYLIPYCAGLMRNVLKFLEKDPRLEDFKYFDNVDKPKKISQEEWDQRGAIWDAMDLVEDDTWSDYVVIEICSYQIFWKICPQFKSPPKR